MKILKIILYHKTNYKIKYHEETFNWGSSEHVEIFLNSHVELINCGFEAIFIDSAKHIGGYDMNNYTGVGALPGYEQMQYILHEIRVRSGCTSVSFVGEKAQKILPDTKILV